MLLVIHSNHHIRQDFRIEDKPTRERHRQADCYSLRVHLIGVCNMKTTPDRDKNMTTSLLNVGINNL